MTVETPAGHVAAAYVKLYHDERTKSADLAEALRAVVADLLNIAPHHIRSLPSVEAARAVLARIEGER